MLQRLAKFSYWKEMTLIFLFKILALFLLWYFCFSPSHKQHLNPELIAEHLLAFSVRPEEAHRAVSKDESPLYPNTELSSFEMAFQASSGRREKRGYNNA